MKMLKQQQSGSTIWHKNQANIVQAENSLLILSPLSAVLFLLSFSVVIDGERGNRPRIYSLEQLFREAVSSTGHKRNFQSSAVITDHPSCLLCISPLPSSLSVSSVSPSLLLYQTPSTLSRGFSGHLNLLSEYEQMGDRIFRCVCVCVRISVKSSFVCFCGCDNLTNTWIHSCFEV